jgi:hypothetical protein
MRIAVVPVALSLVAATAFAQAPSPRETATGTVGGKKVSVEYGRPSLRGRKLEALIAQLPADRIWRAGDNQVTTLTTEGDLMVDGKRVPAGKYSVYVHIPESGAWALVLNSDPGIALGKIWPQAPADMQSALWPRLDGYANVADKEVARVTMTKGAAAKPAELFTIAFAPAGQASTLTLAWGDDSWSVRLAPAK